LHLPFRLADDFNSNNGTNKTGDEGENIPAPDLALVADSLDNGICDNSAANAFGPAYICPEFNLLGNDDFVQFKLNLASETGQAVRALWTNSFDNRDSEANPDFWTVYLLSGYQGTEEKDNDPNGESTEIMLGISDLVEGGVIFLETIRESSGGPNCTPAAIVVHELGHLMGADHADPGVMGGSCSDSPVFSDESIKRIRDKPNAP
jgi:hypothetical protein